MDQPSGSGVKEDGEKCCNGHSEENVGLKINIKKTIS